MTTATAGLRRFGPYPEYKDFGVEWLGEIPAHWRVQRLKTIISDPITDGPHETPEFLTDGVPFLSVDGIQDGELIFEGCRYISEAVHKEYRRKCAPRRDDLLLGKAASTGKIARVKVDVEFSVWSPLALIRPDTADVAPGFLEYALKSAATQAQIDVLCTSNTQKNISMRDIPILIVCLADLQEQHSIAAFLDRETAKIDVLVTNKERLIELLQEKRSALITQAVTKGLDPNVPMKDSGVEWLGEMPAHWELVPSPWLFAESKRRALDGDEQLSATQKYGVIPQAEFERLEGRQVVHVFMHLDQRKHVEVGNFVMSMRSFEGGLERVCARGCVRSSYVVLTPSSEVNVDYFSHLFKSSAYIQALRATSNFIRDGQDLNYNNFRVVRLPSVPLREQEAIAVVLDQEIARIDALMAKVRDAISHQKELRTALITAAVTGKIDMRGEAA